MGELTSGLCELSKARSKLEREANIAYFSSLAINYWVWLSALCGRPLNNEGRVTKCPATGKPNGHDTCRQKPTKTTEAWVTARACAHSHPSETVNVRRTDIERSENPYRRLRALGLPTTWPGGGDGR